MILRSIHQSNMMHSKGEKMNTNFNSSIYNSKFSNRDTP